MKLNQKNWSCPKKQKARLETILQPYRDHFGQTIPADRQYWTLCGQCSTAEGEPLAGSELQQVSDAGLIQADQWHGVEINEDIHALNVAAYPDHHWHCDDFYHAMVVAQAAGQFNPGMVNVDFPHSPDGSAAYLARVMAFLAATTNDVLVVANVILRMRYYKAKTGDYIIQLLNKLPQFHYAMKVGNWTLLDNYYKYEGAGETGSRTWMGTLVFVLK